jgi:hypothetical protein
MDRFVVWYVVASVLLVSPVWAQDPLQEEAVAQAKIAFERDWVWSEAAVSMYLAYKIPLNQFTHVLGQTEPVERYIRAKEVGFKCITTYPRRSAERI